MARTCARALKVPDEPDDVPCRRVAKHGTKTKFLIPGSFYYFSGSTFGSNEKGVVRLMTFNRELKPKSGVRAGVKESH